VSRGPAVLVAGAGVFGAAIALGLARAGLQVTLADPAGLGDNASGAAAGMLAPAFEALLDPVAAGHFSLLRAARDLWPDFVGAPVRAAMDLRRSGAVWLALPDDPPDLIETRAAGLQALGAAAEPWTALEIAGRVPGLDGRIGAGLFTPEDWRLAPVPALAALQAAAEAAGARRIAAAVAAFEPGRARLLGGERLAADLLVVATGAEPSGLAPELSHLAPIKGHILRFAAAGLAAAGPSLRCRLGYASGGVDGLCVGATMEAGLGDRRVDPAVVARLMGLATALSPALAAEPVEPLAAVRAASPDGLPLVGRSAREGVFLAVGARRNGWLLAPMVAHMTTALLAGGDPAPHADLFDPRRFARA
jgi:glycine oxidase